MSQQGRQLLQMVKIVFVVLLMVGLSAALLSSLSSAKKRVIESKLREATEWRESSYYSAQQSAVPVDTAAGVSKSNESRPSMPVAHIKSFKATIDITPRKSVATDRAESIYETTFTAEITAINPDKSPAVRLELPLPPEIISLSDLELKINGDESQALQPEQNRLIWQGPMDNIQPSRIKVTYTAVGKGLYRLEPPPGKIIDELDITLRAHHTDVRMMDLSLQPAEPDRTEDGVTYHWAYKKLMYGRPIAMDVLGIAPVDRLGALSWLGPVGVLAFGTLLALLILAYRPNELDTWMLLLLVGAFAGGLPLMYFAQEFMPLTQAVLASAAVVLAIVAVRAATRFGAKVGLGGVLLLAIAVLAVVLTATIYEGYRSVLLTIGALFALTVAMILLPKAQQAFPKPEAICPPAPPVP